MVAIRKAVIPAAGLGTRFLPVTKVVPKELLPIVDRPTIQLVIEELHAAGVQEFILVVSKGKESIRDHFQAHEALEAHLEAKAQAELLKSVRLPSSFGKITLVYQDKPRGLGHAVLCARAAVGNEPFLVALGDDLIDATPGCAAQMVERFNRYGKAMVAVQRVERSEVHKYGIVAPRFHEGDPQRFLDEEKRLLPLADLVEKPSADKAPSHLAIVGRYLLLPEIFEILQNTAPGAGGEIQLTDGLKAFNLKHPLLAYEFQGLRLDAGDKFGYLQANIHYGLRHPEIGERLRRFLERMSG